MDQCDNETWAFHQPFFVLTYNFGVSNEPCAYAINQPVFLHITTTDEIMVSSQYKPLFSDLTLMPITN